MDGFKTTPKMQHFKEGGSVERATNFTKRDRKNVPEAGMEPAKKVVKKAFGMHDGQMHEGEKTDLSALKKGGRAKKEAGSVRKYKTGGSVENVYGAKKKAGDLDRIEKAKDIKPAKADAASGAKGGPNKYKTGGGVKKMAVGGSALNDLMQAKELARLANARKYLNKDQQGQFAAGEMQQTPAMTGLGAQATAPETAAMQPQVQAPGGVSPAGAIPMQKRGGKVKKMNTGGTCP